MATTPTPSPSASYPGITGTNPVAGTVNTQGDMPFYAQSGPSNIVYGATYASSLAAGGTPDLVGWSYAKPAGGLFSGLSQKFGTVGQGGLTYYALPGFLEQWGQLTPDQRTTIQKQLLAAGLYSSAYYPSAGGTTAKQPLYGAAADYDTIQALTGAWVAAKQTGQTIDTVLGQANAAAMNAAKIYQQNTAVGIFDQSDPAEIRGIADQQAIATLGRKATADEKALAVSMVQAAQVAQQQGKFNQTVAANRADVATQLAGGIGGTQGAVPSTIAANTPASVNALVSALGGQESGSPTAGGYTAVNPDSGATGRFQIMPGNWASWSQAAGLGPNAPMTPQNQEIVARNQISVYLADGGGDPSYVAVAWYAGEGTAKAFQADPTNPKWKQPQGKYPSIYSYAQSIVGKIGAATPGTLAAQAAAGAPPIPPVGGPGGPANAGSINVGQGGAATSLAGEVGSINVGQRPAAIPTAGTSLAGEVGSIGAVPGAPGASGLTGVNTGAAMTTGAGGLPTPAQLIPTSTGVYTQVNPQADVAEMLRKQNPLGASAHDFEQILDAIRQMFSRGS